MPLALRPPGLRRLHPPKDLTSGVFGNQSAAFSVHGALRPAAAAPSDPVFATGRFTTLLSRRPVPVEESAHA